MRERKHELEIKKRSGDGPWDVKFEQGREIWVPRLIKTPKEVNSNLNSSLNPMGSKMILNFFLCFCDCSVVILKHDASDDLNSNSVQKKLIILWIN